jgi:serine/threonine protein kinase/tetratricopeptide (TPR) repeat protein
MDATQTLEFAEIHSLSPDAKGFTTLAERLAEEMAFCWRQGERPTAEEFLSRYQELKQDTEAVLKLICEEICLRQDYGQKKEAVEVLEQFPQWRSHLETRLNGYRRSRKDRGGPGFPVPGERWTDFQLLAELGRGGYGRVFLAMEPRLANRPVVLKMSSADGGEHLTLARLQHTHIVPLNAVQEDPGRNLRALCMPYFGGASLAQLLDALQEKPVARRTGRDLVDVLDQIQAKYSIVLPSRGPARQLLANATYVQALSWIGACLAEGLQHAHERGLVHLDVKPANVLLAADGQPMLLDFHLAQQPLRDGGPAHGRFGGTPKYMSPEQRLRAAAAGKHTGPLPAVDERSDIYSLGLVLYEALAGRSLKTSKKGSVVLPSAGATSVTEEAGTDSLPVLQPLRQQSPQVTVGLADLIHKCLAPDPKDRYRDAAALAADLRRHLSDLPLVGVKNRSVAERWRKWRRRKPPALALAGMLLVMLVATVAVIGYTVTHVSQRLRDAETTLAEGQEQMRGHAYEEAARNFGRGLALADGLPGSADMMAKLSDQLQLAHKGRAADHLHLLANHIRLLYADDSRSRREAQSLEEQCQKVWDARFLIGQHGQGGLEAAVEEQIRTDLLDLAILWANLRGRWARGDQVEEARRDALRILAKAEELLGPSAILAQERELYAEKLGPAVHADAAASRIMALVPRTAWEHFCLGRSLLGLGQLAQAVAEFDRALLLNPQDFWASFYRGQCAYRLKSYADAVNAFSICLAIMPTSAHCFYNRALARTALGETGQALLDYDRSLELDPNLGEAALNRGILHYNRGNYAAAITDLRRALELRMDAATVHYNLALVYLRKGDQPLALDSLKRALDQDGAPPEARTLWDQLHHKR